jgi:hypothetical protein
VRRLWRLWKRRRSIDGEYYVVTIEGAWWRPSNRRSARIAAAVADQCHPEISAISRRIVRDTMLYGKSEMFEDLSKPVPDFVPDEWPYPDEDPPDPL